MTEEETFKRLKRIPYIEARKIIFDRAMWNGNATDEEYAAAAAACYWDIEDFWREWNAEETPRTVKAKKCAPPPRKKKKA